MHDVPIFLILVVVAVFFRWLKGKAENADEPPSPRASPNETPMRPAAGSEQERVRRFLEALGAPPGSAPPPAARPRPVRPRRVVTPQPARLRPRSLPRFGPTLPPLVTTPKEDAPNFPLAKTVESQSASATPWPELALPHALSALPKAQTVARVTSQASLGSDASLGDMSPTPENLRRLILWREILGPPRGLARSRAGEFFV